MRTVLPPPQFSERIGIAWDQGKRKGAECMPLVIGVACTGIARAAVGSIDYDSIGGPGVHYNAVVLSSGVIGAISLNVFRKFVGEDVNYHTVMGGVLASSAIAGFTLAASTNISDLAMSLVASETIGQRGVVSVVSFLGGSVLGANLPLGADAVVKGVSVIAAAIIGSVLGRTKPLRAVGGLCGGGIGVIKEVARSAFCCRR